MRATLDETRLPRPGDVLAERFRLDEVRGTGGMGIVFAATHLGLERQVAIKVLHPSLANRVHVQRFFREARAAGSLSSPHVVQVLDVGQLDDGAPFMVMELLDGWDLSTLLRHRGRLSIPEAASYVVQACSGMEAAHAAGIVHRDLKPGNLFLARQAEGPEVVKVLDFGISKFDALEVEATLTRTHDLIGSPQYMAPEQLRTPQDVDHLADIWSMGAILFRLLSGEPLFDRAGPALLAAVLMDVPRRLRAVMPSIPPELDAIVGRCLERERELRFGSMRELAEALMPFCDARYRATTQAEPPPRTITPSASGPLGLVAESYFAPAFSGEIGAPVSHGASHAPAVESRPFRSPGPPPPPSERTVHTAMTVLSRTRRGPAIPLVLAGLGLVLLVTLVVALARPRAQATMLSRSNLPTYVRALAFGARIAAAPADAAKPSVENAAGSESVTVETVVEPVKPGPTPTAPITRPTRPPVRPGDDVYSGRL